MQTPCLRRAVLGVLYVVHSAAIARSSPCPLGEDTVSFEKVVALKPSSSRLSPMFAHREGFGAGGLTSDCLRRCQATPHCVGVVVNYEHNACFAASVVGPVPPLGPFGPGQREETLVPASDRSSYFAKMCVHGPACERDWLMERVPGKELRGFDDRIVSGVPSRHRCQELCLHERAFPCRSGEFDPRSRQCRLSSQDRRLQPTAFKPTRVEVVEYFENLCVPTTPEPCDYELRRDVDLYRADTVRMAFNSDQCRALCDASREFACRSFTFSEAQGLCFLSGDDTASLGVYALKMRPGVGFYQRTHCLDPVQLSCTRESMVLTMNTVDPFRGRVYARAENPPCEVLGTGSKSTTLMMRLLDRSCGVTEDDGGRFTTTVVIQHHPLIQQKGDRVIKLFCLFDTANKTVTNTYKVLVSGGSQSPNRRPGIVNATAPSPNIRLRITDRSGADIAGAKLGDELFLRIEVDDDSVFGIFARNLVATSGQNDDSIVLIDNAGCPTDSTIFPALQRSEGKKGLHSRFEAFKFADDVVVRFQVTVQFCLHECAAASCGPEGRPSFGRRKRRREVAQPTTTAPSVTMLPEYPLQREIIVEGMGGNTLSNSKTPSPRDRPSSNTQMVCATPTVVTAVAIAAFLIQLAAIAACVSCVALVRRSWDKEDFETPIHASRATTSVCGTWSRSLNRA